jgi:hypothetical protein
MPMVKIRFGGNCPRIAMLKHSFFAQGEIFASTAEVASYESSADGLFPEGESHNFGIHQPHEISVSHADQLGMAAGVESDFGIVGQ